MAVFQGVRLPGTALPSARPAARPRLAAAAISRSAPAAVRATPRVRPAGMLMAGILAATMLGLVYLTQTLGANVTSSEIRSLDVQREALGMTIGRQALKAKDLAKADTVISNARRLGLLELDDGIVLSAP